MGSIIYNGGPNELQISGGSVEGIATSGTSSSLVDTTLSMATNASRDKILWIYSGTGAGQTRAIESNTTTTFIPYVNFDIIPDSTSLYRVSFDINDLVTQQPFYCEYANMSYNPNAPGVYLYDTVVCSIYINLLSTGCFGGVANNLIFVEPRKGFKSDKGSLIQLGRLSDFNDRRGIDGGNLIEKLDQTGYWFDNWLGDTRFYGSSIRCMYSFADSVNIKRSINSGKTSTNADPWDIRDSVFTRTSMSLFSIDKLTNTTLQTAGGGMAYRENLAVDKNNKLLGAYVSPRAYENPGFNGGDLFDIEFSGSFVPGGVIETPIFLFNFNLSKGVAYFWNANFGNNFDFSTASKWYSNIGNGNIYEGITVSIKVLDSLSVPISGASLILKDVAGNKGWTTGKNSSGSSYSPITAYAIQTDSNGTYIGPFGSNEGAFVVRSLWKRQSTLSSYETAYHPFTFSVRRYAYQFVDFVKDWDQRSIETITLQDNIYITEPDENIALAYTGIVVDFGAPKTVTINEAHTINNVYDYLQALVSSASYPNTPEILKTSDGTNYIIDSVYSFVPNNLINFGSSFLSGTLEYPTTGTYSPSLGTSTIDFSAASGIYDFNGGTFSGTLTLSNTGGGSITVKLPVGTSYVNNGPNITVDSAAVVSINVTAKTISGATLQNARVLLTTDAGGALPFEDTISITSTGGLATVTHTAHGLATNDKIYIKGANQSEYNGIFIITVINVNTYTYAITGAPVSPATGTILATYVVLEGLTDINGLIQNNSFTYTTDQPVTGRIRKSTTSPYYKTGLLSGTITSGGFNATAFLIKDE